MIPFIKICAILIVSVIVTLTQYKCNINRKESPVSTELILQKMTPIKVSEPSALAISFDEKYFWSVCDENSKVYKLTKKGTLVSSFVVDGEDLEDLEGITVIDLSLIHI